MSKSVFGRPFKNSHEFKTVIVVNDFRAVPIAGAIHLALLQDSPVFLIAKPGLDNNDFGDGSSYFQKQLAIRMLRIFAPVEIVTVLPSDRSKTAFHGMLSSLISITRDVTATPESYPGLADGLRNLVAGSLAVLRRVRALQPEHVYVFNGRTASSQPLASQLHRSGEMQISVYEWGGKKRRTLLVTNHPLHDTVAESKRFVNWARARRFEFDEQKARTFIDEKLAYAYATSDNAKSLKRYRTVIFAGSPHEHAVVEINNLSVLDADTTALVKRAIDLGVVALPAALRLHPNMARDPSIQGQRVKLLEFLSAYGIDLLGPEVEVSAQALIESAQYVVVGNSSVGLDAIFLGKWPIIVGHPPYKDLVDEVLEIFPGDHRNALRVAGLVHDYEDPHVHRFGATASLTWLALRFLEKIARR